jgi:Flp pilus assembly protein TadG
VSDRCATLKIDAIGIKSVRPGMKFPGLGSARGQSVLEFALVAPVLLLLLVGVVDLGHALRSSVVVINAAYVGARFASTAPAGTAAIRASVQSAAAGTDVVLTDIAITYPSGNAAGRPVRVTVTYQFTSVFGAMLGHNTIILVSAVDAMIL